MSFDLEPVTVQLLVMPYWTFAVKALRVPRQKTFKTTVTKAKHSLVEEA
jgi:hypothetical protein